MPHVAVLTSTFLLAITHVTMAMTTIEDLYPHSKNNLSSITWAHAVNSQAELSKALANSEIAMLEADVIVGKLNSNPPNATDMVIMGHPPTTTSDLSLEDFLKKVTTDKKKGIKLDFKSIEAFEMAVPLIKKTVTEQTPLWLNADILHGPLNANNQTAVPVDPKRFFLGATQIPQGLLSLGWTTRYESGKADGAYTAEHVNEMVKVLQENRVNQSVTYPVRAYYAANSLKELQTLLTNTKANKPTLTIWSSDGDKIDPVKVSNVIKSVGVDKAYVDLPMSQWKELNLSSAAFVAQNSLILVLATMFVSLFAAKLL